MTYKWLALAAFGMAVLAGFSILPLNLDGVGSSVFLLFGFLMLHMQDNERTEHRIDKLYDDVNDLRIALSDEIDDVRITLEDDLNDVRDELSRLED